MPQRPAITTNPILMELLAATKDSLGLHATASPEQDRLQKAYAAAQQQAEAEEKAVLEAAYTRNR